MANEKYANNKSMAARLKEAGIQRPGSVSTLQVIEARNKNAIPANKQPPGGYFKSKRTKPKPEKIRNSR